MPHSYCFSLYHCVFSTKDRRPLLVPEMRERLWAFLGGVARDHAMTALMVGGMEDHDHLLLSLPAVKPVATAMREIKGVSSHWLHQTFDMPHFGWQEGYGAFSIGMAQIEATRAYIANQTEHHRKRDFQAEFVAMLNKHGIAYDPRYIWG
jgi:REP element-mobilizing transposase RayT